MGSWNWEKSKVTKKEIHHSSISASSDVGENVHLFTFTSAIVCREYVFTYNLSLIQSGKNLQPKHLYSRGLVKRRS